MSPHTPLQAIYQENTQVNTALSLYLCIFQPFTPICSVWPLFLWPLFILYPFCKLALSIYEEKYNVVYICTVCYVAYWTLPGKITLQYWWLSTRCGEGSGDRVKSNSQSSQHARYLKAPPTSLNGNPLLPDLYEPIRKEREDFPP